MPADHYLYGMSHWPLRRRGVCAMAFASALSMLAASAVAQVNPSFPPGNAPPPLMPVPPPPVINGPLSQSPPTGLIEPRRLDTHSDRTTRCLHYGASRGLRGERLDAYTRECVNE
jgi:hypothetical protein